MGGCRRVYPAPGSGARIRVQDPCSLPMLASPPEPLTHQTSSSLDQCSLGMIGGHRDYGSAVGTCRDHEDRPEVSFTGLRDAPTPPLAIGACGFAAQVRVHLDAGPGGVTVRSAVMDVAALVIAVFGAVLGMASLAWQLASHLRRGRITVELRVGAMHDKGSRLLTTKFADIARKGEDPWTQLVKQGYTHPVITVRVRATGRVPVTVERYGVWHARHRKLAGRTRRCAFLVEPLALHDQDRLNGCGVRGISRPNSAR
jgi:hypothetical protein